MAAVPYDWANALLRRVPAWLQRTNGSKVVLGIGDVIGTVEVKLDDKVVHSADLIALDAVDEGGIFRRVWDSIRLFFYSLFN